MWLAIIGQNMEIAAILESKGAICTKEEIGMLGKKYTNFISFITNRRELAKKKELVQEIQEEPPRNIPQANLPLKDQSPQQVEEIEVLRQQIKKLKDETREKDRIIQDKEATIQQKEALVEEKEATIQQKEAIVEEKEATIQQMHRSIEEKEKRIQREEKMQMQLWKFKQKQVGNIGNFQDLQLISKIAHGCDAVVFNCSALDLGIPSVALKILFNFGIDTTKVPTSFAKEYAILKELPFHPNIIPIWKEFLDRPTQPFIDLFPPDLKPYVVNGRTGTVRSTTCILMPLLECFQVFFDREFKNIGVSEKLTFIGDILSGLVFLFENHVVHRDMKLNNLLINSNGRIIISDFGCSTKLAPNKTIYIAPGGSIGGNPVRLAPEIRKVDTSVLDKAILVDYSKQASFELGMVAFEIFFGEIPDPQMFGEHMDDAYFNRLCVDDSHKIPEMFEWLRGLLYSDPQRRTALLACTAGFRHIQNKF